MGFIKGTIESGETPQQTAAREFKEETFTELPIDRFVQVQPNVFKVDVTDEEATAILQNWETHFKKGFGELVELKWVPIKDIPSLSLNRDSQGAVKYLGGRRTRRRMFQKPKTLKKRIR